MTRAEVDQRLALFAFMNVHRDEKKQPRPFEPDWPWPEEDPVSPTRRAELMEYLRQNSVFNRD